MLYRWNLRSIRNMSQYAESKRLSGSFGGYKFDILDINGNSQEYGITFRQPILQTPTQELALGITANRRDSDIGYLEALFGQRFLSAPLSFLCYPLLAHLSPSPVPAWKRLSPNFYTAMKRG